MTVYVVGILRSNTIYGIMLVCGAFTVNSPFQSPTPPRKMQPLPATQEEIPRHDRVFCPHC